MGNKRYRNRPLPSEAGVQDADGGMERKDFVATLIGAALGLGGATGLGLKYMADSRSEKEALKNLSTPLNLKAAEYYKKLYDQVKKLKEQADDKPFFVGVAEPHGDAGAFFIGEMLLNICHSLKLPLLLENSSSLSQLRKDGALSADNRANQLAFAYKADKIGMKVFPFDTLSNHDSSGNNAEMDAISAIALKNIETAFGRPTKEIIKEIQFSPEIVERIFYDARDVDVQLQPAYDTPANTDKVQMLIRDAFDKRCLDREKVMLTNLSDLKRGLVLIGTAHARGVIPELKKSAQGLFFSGHTVLSSDIDIAETWAQNHPMAERMRWVNDPANLIQPDPEFAFIDRRDALNVATAGMWLAKHKYKTPAPALELDIKLETNGPAR